MDKNDGWVRLYRQTIVNDIWRHDKTAFNVFQTILMLVDKDTGDWSGGRFQLCEAYGVINPSTMYKALLRLEKEKMVTLSSNTRYTKIHICKWSHYQSKGNTKQAQPSNNQVTTSSQPSNTLTRSKELRIKNNNNNVEIQSIYDLYCSLFKVSSERYKLTPARVSKLKSRLEDSGKQLLEEAIKKTSKSAFHRGENDRGWRADLDFIIRTYEQVEKLANMDGQSFREPERMELNYETGKMEVVR